VIAQNLGERFPARTIRDDGCLHYVLLLAFGEPDVEIIARK
jgi:hypothetical protein